MKDRPTKRGTERERRRREQKDGGSSELSGLALALYVQSVKMGYVRETDAMRLKATTLGRPAKERGSGSLPDGNSLQEHKEETSGNILPWKEDNYSMIQKWPFQRESHHNCSRCSRCNSSNRVH